MSENLPATLNDLSEQINHYHRECESAVIRSVQYAVQAGELLIEAKRHCPHGTWEQWLADNFAGSDRTARVYMRIARGWPELSKTAEPAVLSITGALKALSEPRQVTTQASYELHPIAAELLIPFRDDEYAAFVESIREAGLLLPIALYEGKILDGWHRYQACVDAGVEPHFIEVSEEIDPVAYWRSVNMLRSHNRDYPQFETDPSEQSRISRLEKLETGIEAALDVARAFRDIRDRQGYKVEGYASFDAYCREQWPDVPADVIEGMIAVVDATDGRRHAR